MITLDKTCRDIVAKYLSTISTGKILKFQFKAKDISKVEYHEKLFNLVDELISGEDGASAVEKVFDMQDYFEFNPMSQLDKLNSQEASCIIEPLILKRIDAEGNVHYICDSLYKQGDIVIKKLPFNPVSLERLYTLMSDHHYYTAGANIGNNNILCFGINQEAVIAYRKNLIKSIEGGR